MRQNRKCERCEELAQYLVENRTTVRAVAQRFGISKSTVHKDITERLEYLNYDLYEEIKKIMEIGKYIQMLLIG